jgi:hypothetical protein
MVEKELDDSGTLRQPSSLSTGMSSARTGDTHRHPEVLFREPYISPEPQSRQALVSVHLKYSTLILRSRVPKNVVLSQYENGCTYGAGFQL